MIVRTLCEAGLSSRTRTGTRGRYWHIVWILDPSPEASSPRHMLNWELLETSRKFQLIACYSSSFVRRKYFLAWWMEKLSKNGLAKHLWHKVKRRYAVHFPFLPYISRNVLYISASIQVCTLFSFVYPIRTRLASVTVTSYFLSNRPRFWVVGFFFFYEKKETKIYNF